MSLRLFSRPFLPFAVAGIVLASSPAAAGQAPNQPDLLQSDVIGQGEGDSEATDGGVAKINKLDRTENGFSTLAWTMHNQGSETITLGGNVVGQTYLYHGSPFSGITLLDPVEETRYHPLMDDESGCLCSAGSGRQSEMVEVVGSNKYATYWSTYQLPEDVEAVTVEIPGFEPIEDVPVG